MSSQIGKLSTQGGEFTSETGWDQGWTPEASRMTLEQKMMPESWLQKTFLFHRYEGNQSRATPEILTHPLNQSMTSL